MSGETTFYIIGAGPSGLTLATYLLDGNTKDNISKIVLIDREASIGGCHRVRRVDGYMTEHGPRIYLDNYKNFINILNKIDRPFDSLFMRYYINMTNIGEQNIKNLE